MPAPQNALALKLLTRGRRLPETLALVFLVASVTIAFFGRREAIGWGSIALSVAIYIAATLAGLFAGKFFVVYGKRTISDEDRKRGLDLTQEMLSWIKAWVTASFLAVICLTASGLSNSKLAILAQYAFSLGIAFTLWSFMRRIQKIT